MRILNEWERQKLAGELLSAVMRGLEEYPTDKIASLRDPQTWGELWACAVRAVDGFETFATTGVTNEAWEANARLALAIEKACGFVPVWSELISYMDARLDTALAREEAR